MEIKSINYILIIVIIVLALNLVFPLKVIFGKLAFSNLGCELNGNYVGDINLCCHEIARFQKCENGNCNSKNYEINADKKTLNYCKLSGYDVRF